MSNTHEGRSRHRQAARNLIIAVATAALAGGGVAVAADGGGAPAVAKRAAAAGTLKPASGASGAPGANPRDRGPLAENEPVVVQARAALGRLVGAGTIDQSEADVVLRDVIAGSVDPGALVRAGEVSAAHMPAIVEAITAVKRANASGG
jgi:hypothetical protein